MDIYLGADMPIFPSNLVTGKFPSASSAAKLSMLSKPSKSSLGVTNKMLPQFYVSMDDTVRVQVGNTNKEHGEGFFLTTREEIYYSQTRMESLPKIEACIQAWLRQMGQEPQIRGRDVCRWEFQVWLTQFKIEMTWAASSRNPFFLAQMV